MNLKIIFTLFITVQLFFFGGSVFASGQENLFLQVVNQRGGEILLEYQVNRGDFFYLDYTHSSDLTPVHDIFRIDQKGRIILIAEDYLWYGSGLEFHPDVKADIISSGKWTRVRIHRIFSHFLLRVGRVAGHVLTYKEKKIPLLNIAKGGTSVWIRVVTKTTNQK